jgi:hypothetical protein
LQRLRAHLEVLYFDPEPGHFDDQVVNDLEVQIQVGHQLLLNALQDGMRDHQQHAAHAAMPVVGRRLVALFAKLFQQIGPKAARVRELFQLRAGQLLQFRLCVVAAAFFADARPDLPHDLLDVHRVRSHIQVCH